MLAKLCAVGRLMSDTHIPQECCATCRHWSRAKEEAYGHCSANDVYVAQFIVQPLLTLDLAVCSKWQENSEQANAA